MKGEGVIRGINPIVNATGFYMLKKLKRWRKYLGLRSLLSVNQSTPLISKQFRALFTSDRPIRRLVQESFDEIISRLIADDHL